MQNSDTESPKVTFFPPLHHQRRIWILDILRRERLVEVLDIGCGEGALLTTLCQPAPWLNPGRFQDTDNELSSLFSNVGLVDQDTPDLHPKRVVGLDISSSQLAIAAQQTSPSFVNPLYTRWEPLDVELWQGNVAAVNPAFVNVQCIVASELIEHLTDDVLVQVAPIVLGVYRPRMFLVTTPSYTFNQRWSAPGSTDPKGYPDPTSRTDRVFRHPDHKFEWTVDEFAQWCNSAAHQWGYAVEITTIGMAKEQDPWGREILGGATQVACFRRLDNRFSKPRRGNAQVVHNAITESHTLVAKYHHDAHPRAGHPSDLREIEQAIIAKFQDWRESVLGIQELWFAETLALLCGGSMDVMLDVAEQSTQLELQKVVGQPRANWKVQLIAQLTYHHPPSQDKFAETENAMCEDEETDYDGGENSFDSGVHMGTTYDGMRPENDGWTQGSGSDDWATNWNESWVNTTGQGW
ncbi:hypothetical protein JVU11DRAFT_4127 [Chiua virens]|nr:hypothetical protein JVU11DRAFT_4127 [Chiua virens]